VVAFEDSEVGIDSDAPAEAEADTAASPLATMVTPGPAAVVVPGPTRPAVVSVAELMLTVDEVLVAAASDRPAGTSPPAEMVMAEATVCMVLAAGAMELMEPSMNGGACAADMGNDPAGHKHAQLQACCCATCPAFTAVPFELPLPLPAMIVTPVPGAVVVFVAMRASGVRVAELMDAVELVFASALAVAFPPPPTPAITVTPPPAAEFPPATVVAFAAEPDPEPATTVTAAAAPPLVVVPAAVALEPLSFPATTVMAAAAPPLVEPAAAAEAVVVELEPPPFPATTVTAPAAPPLAELTEPAAAAEAVVVELEPPPFPATTVTAPAAPPLAELTEPAAAAEAEVELDPLPAPASTVTAAPAAVVVAEAMRASVVNFAESTETALEDVIADAAASAAEPGAPPAEIVTGMGTPAAAFCVEFAKGADSFIAVLVASAVISLMLLMEKGPVMELVVAALLVSAPPALSVMVPGADIYTVSVIPLE
jgi:hypothetical protein